MNMKKPVKKLNVSRQTVRLLAIDEIGAAIGGWIRPPISWSCPQPSVSDGCSKIA
jgi:hypothetical protein